MDLDIPVLELPDDLVLSDELISLEKPVEHVPFNNLKMKQHVASGPAFHEKKESNQKVNRKIRREEAMKIKYGKPQKKKRK